MFVRGPRARGRRRSAASPLLAPYVRRGIRAKGCLPERRPVSVARCDGSPPWLAGSPVSSCPPRRTRRSPPTARRPGPRWPMRLAGAQAAHRGATLRRPIPPDGTPHGVSTPPLGGFPRRRRHFAILTSGDAALAERSATSASDAAHRSAAQGHGDPRARRRRQRVRHARPPRSTHDVPAGANCLELRLPLLLRGVPRATSATVNDGFLAQLDTLGYVDPSTGDITAPTNFAFDDRDAVISVNTSGARRCRRTATGTTYDGAHAAPQRRARR